MGLVTVCRSQSSLDKSSKGASPSPFVSVELLLLLIPQVTAEPSSIYVIHTHPYTRELWTGQRARQTYPCSAFHSHRTSHLREMQPPLGRGVTANKLTAVRAKKNTGHAWRGKALFSYLCCGIANTLLARSCKGSRSHSNMNVKRGP